MSFTRHSVRFCVSGYSSVRLCCVFCLITWLFFLVFRLSPRDLVLDDTVIPKTWLFFLDFCLLPHDLVPDGLAIHNGHYDLNTQAFGLSVALVLTNMRCVSCHGVLDDNMQSYNIDHVGIELTVVLEEILNHEVDHDGVLCSNCFDNTVRRLSQGIEHLTANRCVRCLESVSGRHAHSLPEGPERDYIALLILPRQIQPGNIVCYACWLAARRNVRRQQDRQGTSPAAQDSDSQHIAVIESQPSTSNDTLNCVWCQRSLSGIHTHSLPQGPERDEIAFRILPRQIELNSRVCYACWMAARRNTGIGTAPPASSQNESTRLPNYSRAGNSSNTCFVQGSNNNERLTIPQFLKLKLLKMHKLYLPQNARICREHLGIYDWGILEEHRYGHNFSVDEIEDVINLALEKEETQLLDFEKIELMSDELCHYWSGLNKQKITTIIEQTPLLREHIKKYKTALGIYLVKLRTGEPNSRLAELFGMSESNVSSLLRKTREILNEQFVPLYLGVAHLPRQDIVNHNLTIPNGLFGGEEGGRRKAIVICDGTYVYLQKSSNYLFQKKSYSLHKYRNLIKPFLIVTTDGHILDIYGPYAATVSDAEIMNQLFRNESSELRQYFREGDVFILDRGFRDSIQMLTSLNYTVCKPESLQTGETQLPTLRANKSRHVTMCRWVVEVVNGRFKRDFKLVRNDFSNNAATHLMMDFRIAGAIINAFHVPIIDRPDASAILDRAKQKLNVPNILSEYVIEINMNRRRAHFHSIDAGVTLLEEFPVMTMSELILFALGTYQIKQARSYYGEHIRENDSFIIEICDAEQIHIPNICAQETKLIRGRIKSRHTGSKIYYTYILLNMAHTNWEHRIHSYYCSCIVGKRTVGCCAHIMTIIWYMGWARHQENITAPATFLDNILVRDEIENEER